MLVECKNLIANESLGKQMKIWANTFSTTQHRCNSMWHRLQSHIHIVHFPAHSDSDDDDAAHCTCKSAKKTQSGVQLRQHLFVLPTNSFPWIFISLLCRFFSIAVAFLLCVGFYYYIFIFMSDSLCFTYFFGVHFQFFVVYSFTCQQIQAQARSTKSYFATPIRKLATNKAHAKWHQQLTKI